MKPKTTKALGRRRLLRLAKHLRSGKLEHKKFYFGDWNTDKYLIRIESNGCGYAGCAIGECPRVFPSHWHWVNGLPLLRGARRQYSSGTRFFALSERYFEALFIAGFQFGHLPFLGRSATRRQVAANIETFVKAGL